MDEPIKLEWDVLRICKRSLSTPRFPMLLRQRKSASRASVSLLTTSMARCPRVIKKLTKGVETWKAARKRGVGIGRWFVFHRRRPPGCQVGSRYRKFRWLSCILSKTILSKSWMMRLQWRTATVFDSVVYRLVGKLKAWCGWRKSRWKWQIDTEIYPPDGANPRIVGYGRWKEYCP